MATTTTDANGNHSFTVTPAPTRSPQAPDGYVGDAAPNQGNDASDSDIDALRQDRPDRDELRRERPTVDAGFYRRPPNWARPRGSTPTATASRTQGEAGVAGVKVTLLDASGNAVGSPLTTDANGNYLFTGLQAPAPTASSLDKTTLPAGYSFTTANTGADARTDANVTDGKTAQTVLTRRNWTGPGTPASSPTPARSPHRASKTPTTTTYDP